MAQIRHTLYSMSTRRSVLLDTPETENIRLRNLYRSFGYLAKFSLSFSQFFVAYLAYLDAFERRRNVLYFCTSIVFGSLFLELMGTEIVRAVHGELRPDSMATAAGVSDVSEGRLSDLEKHSMCLSDSMKEGNSNPLLHHVYN